MLRYPNYMTIYVSVKFKLGFSLSSNGNERSEYDKRVQLSGLKGRLAQFDPGGPCLFFKLFVAEIAFKLQKERVFSSRDI